MNPIRWTNEALEALNRLTDKDRRELLDHLDLVSDFPAMYPVRQRGRFVGLRYFVVRRRWLVYYRFKKDVGVLIFDVVSALAPM